MKPASIGAAVVVVLVALSFVTGSKAPHHPGAVVGTAPVIDTTLVCPAVNDTPAGTTPLVSVADVARAVGTSGSDSGTVTATTLLGTTSKAVTLHPAPAVALHGQSGQDESVAVTGSGSVAATLAADQVLETPAGRYRALGGAPCVAPATDWWFAGLDGRVGFSDSLVLANPASTPAEVGVTLWTGKGAVSSPRLGAIPIPPQSRRLIRISQAAPNVPEIAMHVRAESGAIAAAVVERRTSALVSEGGDMMPPTLPPSRTQVVSGFARGTGTRNLVLSNPGQAEAVVGLKLVTGSGTFTPSGVNQVVVKPQHTVEVGLSTVFGAQTGAVEVTSDEPVLAEGRSALTVTGKRPDLMWLGATAPLQGPAAVANGMEPDGGQCFLLLTAPQAAGTVKVSTPFGRSTMVSVPAGRSVEVDITARIRHGAGPWPFVVTSAGGGPVYGTRMLNFGGAHGALITSEPLSPLPRPIPLPPVRSDPRVAVK
jgi:hypothetical protein